ncbi:hypothetical protein ACVILK_003462 [Bradyrhizobium embrapense]
MMNIIIDLNIEAKWRIQLSPTESLLISDAP